MGVFSWACFSAPAEGSHVRALKEDCQLAKVALGRAQVAAQRQLETAKTKAPNSRAKTAIYRPLHQLMSVVVQLRCFELLTPLLDRLASDATCLFASDRLVTLQQEELAMLVYVAARVPEVKELVPVMTALKQQLGGAFLADATNDKTCQAKGVPPEIYRLFNSPRVRSRLLTDALGDSAAVACRLNLDSAESSPIKPARNSAGRLRSDGDTSAGDCIADDSSAGQLPAHPSASLHPSRCPEGSIGEMNELITPREMHGAQPSQSLASEQAAVYDRQGNMTGRGTPSEAWTTDSLSEAFANRTALDRPSAYSGCGSLSGLSLNSSGSEQQVSFAILDSFDELPSLWQHRER